MNKRALIKISLLCFSMLAKNIEPCRFFLVQVNNFYHNLYFNIHLFNCPCQHAELGVANYYFMLKNYSKIVFQIQSWDDLSNIMSYIDVEGSDDEVIVVIESPDRQIITDDIDVEAVTDEEVAIANSEAS